MKSSGLRIRPLLISIVISVTVGLTWLTIAWAQTGGSLDLRRNVVYGQRSRRAGDDGPESISHTDRVITRIALLRVDFAVTVLGCAANRRVVSIPLISGINIIGRKYGSVK